MLQLTETANLRDAITSRSQIALRMLTYGAEVADATLLARRIHAAVAFRQQLGIDGTAYAINRGILFAIGR